MGAFLLCYGVPAGSFNYIPINLDRGNDGSSQQELAKFIQIFKNHRVTV